MSKINIAIDATMLTALMECPRKMDLRINKSMVPISGKANSLECGSLVHAILEWFNKSIIAGKSRTDAITIGFAAGHEYRDGYKESNLYITDPTETGLINTPEESDKKYTGWKNVLETMEEYFDHYKNDSWTVLAAEETRSFIIYEDDDLRILWKAKYDQISDTPTSILPIDHKTMKQRRDSVSLNNQFMGQCLTLRVRQLMINKIGFQTSLKANEKFTRVFMPYSTDRLAEFANEVVPYYVRMYIAYHNAEYWPPNFTSCDGKYGYCNMKQICEHDRNTRDEAIRINFIKGKEWDV